MKKKAVLLFLSVLCSCFILGCEKTEESKEPWSEYFSLFGLHDDEVVERLGEGEMLYNEIMQKDVGRTYQGNPYSEQGTTEICYGIDYDTSQEKTQEELEKMEYYVVFITFRIPQNDAETKNAIIRDLEEKFGEAEILTNDEKFNAVWLHNEYYISASTDFNPFSYETKGLYIEIGLDDGEWQSSVE